ncbi:MAG: LCP family protein [Lachnospiraceae bacterium]|nr:LCP family protein [Lachnospiraceae bacterium]
MEKDHTSDKNNTYKRGNSGGESLEMAEEQKAHQEHLRRLRKYKKKHKQQIVGLVLEVILLLVVVGGFLVVSWLEARINDMQIKPTTTHAAPTLDVRGSDSPTDSNGDTIPYTTTPEQVSWVETDGKVYTDTMPPREPYTNPLERRVVEAQQGYMTIACFGVDARNTTDLMRNAQGDVVILMSIDMESGEMRLASVYRDFFFEFATGQFAKLADAYNRYGADQVMEGMNRNFDLNITNFLVVNWTAVADIIDLMGGIEIEVSQAEAMELDKFIAETMDGTGRTETTDIDYEPGIKRLDGVHTVAYCRIRHGVGNDYARTERQRKVISVILDQVKGMAKSGQFWKLFNIIDIVSKNIKTNLTTSEITNFAMQAGKFAISETNGFPINIVADPDTYMLASPTYSEDVKRLHEYLYRYDDYTPSDNVKRIEAVHQNFIQTGWYPGKE